MASSSSLSTITASRLLSQLPARPGNRYLALADELTALLYDGRITPGTRLPSERELARGLGLSRSTTTAAFNEMHRRGVLERRRGAGSFLTLPPGFGVARSAARVHAPAHDDSVFDLSVAALSSIPGMLTDALAAVIQGDSPYLRADGYLPYGIEELRQEIANNYAARGLPTEPGQILLTNGAQHGLDILLRRLVSSGDRVVVDSPT